MPCDVGRWGPGVRALSRLQALPKWLSSCEEADSRVSGLPQKTALVVESNEILKLCMVNLVEMTGLKVVHASSGDEAIRVLESRSDIALLITNVVMPGSIDGVDLAHAVDDRWPSVKIIVVSGKRGLAESDLPTKSLFFTKPYHDEEIAFEIRALVGP
jgi:two-component system, response regulator PdtaR